MIKTSNILAGTAKVRFKKLSIILLLGMMVLSSFMYSLPASAATTNPVSVTSTVVSANATSVSVTMSVYAAPANTLDDLKNAVTVKRTGASTYSALGANDSIALTGDQASSSSTLVVTFENPLTDKDNSIRIAAGALADGSGTAYDQLDLVGLQGLDKTPPAYIGSTSISGSNVYLNFDEPMSINNDGSVTAATYLQSHMSIATDGVNFVPISNQIDVYPPGQGGNNSSQIRLYANNKMKVILGTNTLIKIDSGTLKDAAGNLNAQMILHVTPPVVQSATISSDYKDVTITFQERVVDNTVAAGSSNLKSSIYLLKDGANSSNWTALTTGDSASVDSAGNLVIHFATALLGANNQININGGALKDSYGNILQDNTLTPLIQGGAGDNAPPKLMQYYLTSNYHDLKMVFNENVQNAKSDLTSLLAGMKYCFQTNWRYVSLPSDADVAISGNTVTIHFPTQLSVGSGNYNLQIESNSFKDESGNTITDYIYMNNLSFNSLEMNDAGISNNGRLFSLYSNVQLADQTMVNGVSHLKEQITISTDHGATFSPLDAQDVVKIQGYGVYVYFHDAKKTGTVEVKISAGALSDLGDNSRNQAIDQVIAYNYPDIRGYFLSNTASEFFFEDNADWRSKVRDITIYDENNEVVRQLNSSEYTLTAGKLTINKGVFQEGVYYYVSINADGYSSKVYNGSAHISNETFYMTAPTVTVENGITAKVNILANYYNRSGYAGTQAVVFELMNGTTPVSITVANMNVNTGTYSANFNVSDAATNRNYTVKAFVVNQFNNDSASVGLNLFTIKTHDELDQMMEL